MSLSESSAANASSSLLLTFMGSGILGSKDSLSREGYPSTKENKLKDLDLTEMILELLQGSLAV